MWLICSYFLRFLHFFLLATSRFRKSVVPLLTHGTMQVPKFYGTYTSPPFTVFLIQVIQNLACEVSRSVFTVQVSFFSKHPLLLNLKLLSDFFGSLILSKIFSIAIFRWRELFFELYWWHLIILQFYFGHERIWIDFLIDSEFGETKGLFGIIYELALSGNKKWKWKCCSIVAVFSI